MQIPDVMIRYFLTQEAQSLGIKFDAPRVGDAGFDLRSSGNYIIKPGQQVVVATGLHVAIPIGWVGIVKDRSSMAIKKIYSHGGVIDASYRGEIKLMLSNSGETDFLIECAMKVAQMVVVPHAKQALSVTSLEELGSSERGQQGFGSTGV